MEWISVKDRTPDMIEGEDYSENVLAILDGQLAVMCYCYIAGEGGGWGWSNCYNKIDGDAEFDDNYYPTHWQPFPSIEITDESTTKGLSDEDRDDEILNNKEKPEYVICAAIHFMDGIIHEHQPKNVSNGFVVSGRRHHNCFFIAHVCLADSYSEVKGDAIQGFLTSKNIFLDRKDAGALAFKVGQIKTPTDCLFSEDLY
jgi:hypothetical protein